MRKRIGRVLLTVLTVAIISSAPLASADDDHLFSRSSYEVLLDGPTPANRASLQPIALTAGQELLGAVDAENVLLRCAVFTGRKGIPVTVGGTVAAGEDPEPIGEFPSETRRTRKTGYALFEHRLSEALPRLDRVEELLLVAMRLAFGSPRKIDAAAATCTLGVLSEACTPDADTACLHGGRFRAEITWRDRFDGRTRQAVVRSSSNDRVTFGFPPLPSSVQRDVVIRNRCGSELIPRSYQVEATGLDVDAALSVIDAASGFVRRYGNRAILDTEAFSTCP